MQPQHYYPDWVNEAIEAQLSKALEQDEIDIGACQGVLLDRLEISVEQYLEYMYDYSFFRWIDDEMWQVGLDPWQYYMDLPIEEEEAIENGWRIFVQINHVEQAIKS